MLLSAARSLLLLSGTPPPDDAGRRLALLRAAAERLRVPLISMSSPNWRVGLATGRSQLVAACVLSDPDVKTLPPGTQAFVVVDCLAEDQRPPEHSWPALAATPVTAEMVVFEWLERGATEAFRDLIPLIR